MRKEIFTTPLLLLTVVAAFLLYGCSDSRRGIYPGEIAPDIVGTDLNGQPLALHAVPGKVVLVNFWATWCAPCVAELPALQSLYTRLKDRGFTIVGVAVDDLPGEVKAMAERYGLTYPILLDPTGKSKRLFELKGFPESFVLDAQHKVMIVPDPGDGTPVTKIIGPREWSKIDAMQLFEGLIR